MRSRSPATANLIDAFYPERAAGGFSRVDGAIEFYLRVNALLTSESVVLDFGAGRGAMVVDTPDSFKRRLRILRGKCANVIGVDVDPSVLSNPTVDEASLLELANDGGFILPMASESVDLIVSDWTLEHITRPTAAATEIGRVLKPGGWLCARTPNKWGYIGLGNRLVPEAAKTTFLRALQPSRRDIDVFPTKYEMNDIRTLQRLFPGWLDCTYATDAEPVYAGRSRLAWLMFMLLSRCTPQPIKSVLMVFMQKPSR